MKKILFVSFNHARQNVADSVQNHRLIGALKEYYDIDVLQRAPKRGEEGVWSPNIYIIDRIIYKFFPFLISVFSLDALLWCSRAYSETRNKLEKYDAVIMIYGPYPTRFYQYKIKKYFNKRVISVLYDPFYDNIFMSPSLVGKKLRAKIEEKIVKESQAIIVNNKKIFNLFKERYPNSNTVLINLCGGEPIKKEALDKSMGANTKVKTLVHSGNIYGERRIDELNEAITRLKKKRPQLNKELNVVILGIYCVDYEKVVDSGNHDVIVCHKPLYGNELVSFMSNSDGFILIDPMNAGNTCFPSKLCEYYQYEKPIFGFAAKGTPSYTSLKEAEHVVCDVDEMEKMVNSLIMFIDDNSSLQFDKSYGNQFNPDAIATEYSKVINII